MTNYTLHLGDCLEYMRGMDAGSVDSTVTDTPYGIGFKYSSYDDTPENWERLMRSFVPAARNVSKFVVMPSCAINRMRWWYENIPPDWVIAWHKGSPGHAAKVGFNDWEPHLCWGRPNRQMHDFFSTRCGFEENGHPCPKPLEYALWLVEKSTRPGDLVADFFMGSGTTGVACMQLGRRFVGCEIDPRYFEIARRRIEAAAAQPPLIQPQAPKHEQAVLSMGGQ